jgi:hypothetical protein
VFPRDGIGPSVGYLQRMALTGVYSPLDRSKAYLDGVEFSDGSSSERMAFPPVYSKQSDSPPPLLLPGCSATHKAQL